MKMLNNLQALARSDKTASIGSRIVSWQRKRFTLVAWAIVNESNHL